jgi:hypothetical protein
MVQVITRKKRRVFTDVEWKLRWAGVFLAGIFLGSFVTYKITKRKKESQPVIRERETVPEVVIDTTNTYSSARHFDCWVDEKIPGEEGTMYITECGVPFYSEKIHSVGDTLKNFKSPKHE